MTIGKALSQVLSAERKAFNARIAAARVRSPGFDVAAFSTFAEQLIDPLVTAIAEHDPDATHRNVVALFDMAVEIVAHGSGGTAGRSAAVGRVWQEIAPRILPMISNDPLESLGALTNVAVQLHAVDGVSTDTWLAIMGELAPMATDNRSLRALAAIAAWRSGAAHLRVSALAAAATLPAELACVAVGASGRDWEEVSSAYAQNRWCRPDSDSATGEQPGFVFGAFTGFGGRFSQPPRVHACDQGFFISSGDQAFLLVVDIFGATLHAATRDEFEATQSSISSASVSLSGSELVAEDRRVPIEWPSDGLAIACNQDTIAVTSHYSHSIRLMPRFLP